jgi:hypothetical protein
MNNLRQEKVAAEYYMAEESWHKKYQFGTPIWNSDIAKHDSELSSKYKCPFQLGPRKP